MMERECASCKHDFFTHGGNGTDVCGECGCWGFFPRNARYCNNVQCEGSCCASERADEKAEQNRSHGSNVL